MLAAAISFLLCKNLLDGLGEISAKLRPATMRMLLGWAIAERAFGFSYTASIANSIVMLGEMPMTFMNEEIMSASSTTATTSALAATLMSTYQDCPVFRGCRRRKTRCALLRSSLLPAPPPRLQSSLRPAPSLSSMLSTDMCTRTAAAVAVDAFSFSLKYGTASISA